MRILVFGGFLTLVLSGCATLGAETEQAAANFANLDRGESLALSSGGRGAYSTWHAGPDRSEQATCVEPSVEAGAAGWRRFEACMSWFNGLSDRSGYQARLAEIGE